MQAFIFDVDGTLVDSVAVHARTWQIALREFGHEVDFDELRGQIGKGGDELMAHVLSPEAIAADGDAIKTRRAAILKDDYLDGIRAFPKVRALFERLRAAGCRIMLASSAHEDELAVYVRKADIGDLIEGATSSDDAERAKPHGDIFQAALDRLPNVGPRNAIVVGDTPYDAEAAAKVGLKTICLLSGGFRQDDLEQAGAVAVYRDPEDLLAHFDAVMQLARDLARNVASA